MSAVRRWQINAMQRATGARVELQSVRWNLLLGEYQLNGLTLHGREAASDPPLLQVRELRLRLRWNFLLGRGFRLRELVDLRAARLRGCQPRRQHQPACANAQ